MEEDKMRDHYDFSNGIKNPYADRLKKQITIRLDDQVIEYFKNMAKEVGVPYQTLIDSYLTDCAKCKRKLIMHWK
jgi:predicted DNA binding CopG/RHH family protein